ncbi:hypothetical protein B0T20DRAFT_410016 [Sordaria brevicollis]|uniref:Uncharacterized protein n=1 Tax=Sordaria brevicollis TaxID=83679 RepID=A0AAE0PGJ4_SORBR|nr:hypothetical protein B0T20DRAFT_410016 [Sordaria brevicollis]
MERRGRSVSLPSLVNEVTGRSSCMCSLNSLSPFTLILSFLSITFESHSIFLTNSPYLQSASPSLDGDRLKLTKWVTATTVCLSGPRSCSWSPSFSFFSPVPLLVSLVCFRDPRDWTSDPHQGVSITARTWVQTLRQWTMFEMMNPDQTTLR